MACRQTDRRSRTLTRKINENENSVSPDHSDSDDLVVARSAGGSLAESTVTVVPNDIHPFFYIYDPILGPDYSSALGKRLETRSEVSLKLEPFFLSKVVGGDTGESYFWTLDGFPITTQTPTLVVLRPKEKTFGFKNLSVVIENIKRRLQQTTLELEVVFDTR